MTLRHLKIFLSIYETGSTTAAAQALHIAQPSVSTALRELEDHYGVPMFERYAKRLRVTEAGRQLYPYAKHLTDLLDEAEDMMRSMGTEGTFRIGTSITIGACHLPQLLLEFQALYPRMTLRVTTENTDAVTRRLLANELDVGLVEGAVRSPFLVVEPYRTDHLILVCRPDHPFARAGHAMAEELVAEPLLLRERGSAVRETFEAALAARSLAAEPVWQSVSTQVLLQAVLAGLGVSVLPRPLVGELVDRGLLAAVPVEGVDFARQFCIVYHKNKFRSAAFHAFTRLCRSSSLDGSAEEPVPAGFLPPVMPG